MICYGSERLYERGSEVTRNPREAQDLRREHRVWIERPAFCYFYSMYTIECYLTNVHAKTMTI